MERMMSTRQAGDILDMKARRLREWAHSPTSAADADSQGEAQA